MSYLRKPASRFMDRLAEGNHIVMLRTATALIFTFMLALSGPLLGVAIAEVHPSDTISRYAGDHVRGFSGDGGPATAARLSQPRDTDVGPNGEVYITDTYNDRIRVVRNGVIRTFAGDGSHTAATNPNVGDNGPATAGRLAWPHDVMADSAGNVWIADSNHNRIRKVGPGGDITTVAGTGTSGATGDGGLATKAQLKNPKTVFRKGNQLFTAGLDHKVRVIDLDTGIISRYAGTGIAGYANGAASSARFSSPQRLQVDATGNVYLADTGNSAIRRIDAGTKQVTTVARAGLDSPRGIALEGSTILYIADSNHHQVKKVNLSTGAITVVAGSVRGFAGDGGPASAAKFYQPRGLTVTPGGDLLVADTFNDEIRLIS